MNKLIRYGRSRRVTTFRQWFVGASRYFTHLIILAITIGAVMLATAKLPEAQGASASTTLQSQATQEEQGEINQLVVVGGPEGVARASDDSYIVRSFVPVSTTVGEGAESAPVSRGLIIYTVQSGDTLFGIAGAYGLTPETVLWSNYKELKDNPDLLSLGMQLLIPPSNGLISEVEEGDDITSLARRFGVTAEIIVNEPLNGLSNINQMLIVGQAIFVPGGERETVVWQIPQPVQVRRTSTGVAVYKVGVCGEVAIPALGTGRFVYPANAHHLSGYNYSGWHPGLDFAGRTGDPIYASDSGTVIYAGYSLNSAGVPVGYGQYVVIDHGNGYQTLYAHASRLYVSCGQQVLQGTQIAGIGSIGRSTGPHLHFEIRRGGVALNPWQILPSP